MPFNIEFMFYFYFISFYVIFSPFLCFFSYRTENMLYDIIDSIWLDV